MFDILHNNNNPICLIGNTVDHRIILSALGNKCQIVSLEHCQTQSQSWFDDHQFFCTAGSTQFSMQSIQTLQEKFSNINWVSMVHQSSDVMITVGKNCWISYGVFVEPDTVMHDHVRLCVNTCIHGGTVLESHVNITPYTLIDSSHLKQGTWVGMRSWISRCVTEPYTVFTMNSRVHDQTFASGTYSSHRKISDLNAANSDPHTVVQP